jgi:HK97 family phage major capsid protein
MTITQMRHKIQALKTKLRTVQNTAKGEKRELTDEEQVEFDAVVEEIEQIEADIEAKKEELLALEVDAEDLRTKRDEFDKKVDTPVDDERSKRNKRSFNLTRAIKAVVNNTQFEDVEARAIELGRKYANESGLSYSGQITLPMFEQRDVTAQTGLGIEAIETDVLQILDPLRNNLVLSKAGATIMTGLRGNVQIPIYAGTTAVWNAETNCQTNT